MRNPNWGTRIFYHKKQSGVVASVLYFAAILKAVNLKTFSQLCCGVAPVLNKHYYSVVSAMDGSKTRVRCIAKYEIELMCLLIPDTNAIFWYK